MRPRSRVHVVLATLALAASACGVGTGSDPDRDAAGGFPFGDAAVADGTSDDAATDEDPDDPTTEDGDDEGTAGTDGPGGRLQPPPGCEDRFLDPDRTVDGQVFADCLLTAMASARTFNLTRTNLAGTDRWDVVLAPELAIDGTTGTTSARVIVLGDAGWMENADGWVQAGGTDGVVEVTATLLVDLTIAATSLERARDRFAYTAGYTFLGTQEDDGHTRWGFAALPEPTLAGATESFEVWIDDAHLPIRAELVTSFGEASETERWDYRDWGHPFEVEPPAGFDEG